VIILFAVVGKFGISQVLSLRSKIESAQKSEKILTQKLALFKTFSTDAVTKANAVTSALPDSNPSIATVSQLKVLAAENGVVLSGIKAAAGLASTTGLNQANISFSLEGTRDQIFTFLTGVTTFSPITLVNNVKVTETAASVKADVSVKSFWAAFPKTIPSVTEPITDFTAAETEILANVARLTQPTFTEMLPSTDINSNPFGE
jgi:hypothetical protein